MTFAWYGHLRFRQAPIWVAIFASWGIAFFEYLLMVPANRWGYNVCSATELKIMQEVITLTVLTGFAITILGEKLRWNHMAAFISDSRTSAMLVSGRLWAIIFNI